MWQFRALASEAFKSKRFSMYASTTLALMLSFVALTYGYHGFTHATDWHSVNRVLALLLVIVVITWECAVAIPCQFGWVRYLEVRGAIAGAIAGLILLAVCTAVLTHRPFCEPLFYSLEQKMHPYAICRVLYPKNDWFYLAFLFLGGFTIIGFFTGRRWPTK